VPLVTPVALEVGAGLAPCVDDSPGGRRFLAELVPMMRDGLFHELGVRVPGVRVRASDELAPGAYSILVHEVPVASGAVPPGRVLVNDTPERLGLLGLAGEAALNPANGCECAWIPAASAALAEQAGLSTWDPAGYLVLHLAAALRRNAAELVGIQEAQELLEQLEQLSPALARETVPKAVSLVQLTDVLRRLVEEGVSIRDLRAILHALAEWGPLEPDPVLLTEHVRAALRRAITHRYTRGTGVLVVYLLDPLLEDTLRAGLQPGPGGATLVLEPELTRAILAAVRAEVGGAPGSAQTPVVLTSVELRRYVRKLLELELPHVAVLSYQELSADTSVQPIARIALP
jgi:type III secretion protein V